MRRHPDAQRHRLHGGGLRSADVGRLCRADQLALQGPGDRLHSRRLWHPGAGRPRRPAGADRRRAAAWDCTDRRVHAAGSGDRLWHRAGAGECNRARARVRILACAAGAVQRRDAHPVAYHVLHLRHHRPPQGCATSGARARADGRHRTYAAGHFRHRAGHSLRRAGAALSLGAQCLCHACRSRRRRDGADAALRSRRVAGADRARAPRHHVHGADHVHSPAEAARGGAAPVRHLVAEVHRPRRGALPARGQAGDDRLVGAGGQRVLRLDRIRAP